VIFIINIFKMNFNPTDPYFQRLATIPHLGVVGYFGPDSMTWQLYREPIVIVGGMRALLLQVAHPAVGEGVAKFSKFKEDALGRGFRTFEAMATIYFGSDVQARETATRLHRMHAGIRSNYPSEVPSDLAGKAFNANEPKLLLWVLATLTDTSLLMFEEFPNRKLPVNWREQFYEESKIAAQLLGIPVADYPNTLPEFKQYMSEMLADDGILGTAKVSAEITDAILIHKLNVTWAARLLAIGWMPVALSTSLGMVADAKSQRNFKRLLSVIKGLYRWTPDFFKTNPAFHQAMYRINLANDVKPTLLERFFGYLGTKAYFPFGLRG
jgi:uncharacterized protein (DUF2236 family)